MLTPEYETLLHRYLDGELDAASTLKVEEHLRGSPAARTYLDELQTLDERLRNALGTLPAPSTELEHRIASRLERPPAPSFSIHDLERYRRTVSALRVAAAVLFLAIGVQIVILLFHRSEPGEDPAGLARLRESLDRLEQENRLLRDRARAEERRFAKPSGTELRPDPLGGGVDPAATVAPEPAAEQPKPDKDAVFASVRDLLESFRRTGKWDRGLQMRIFGELDRLGKLSIEDFRQLRHLYEQQDPHTVSQLFMANILGRYFTHEPEAREFLYGMVQADLNRMRNSKEPWVGDRALRRAWTQGLIHANDSRGLELLYELGRYEKDWVNRKDIYGGLARIGSADAALMLAKLAVGESNPILKQESLNHLYDLIYADPSLRGAIDDSMYDLMREIVLGDIGENGENFDSQVWALYILANLGYPIEELKREWEERNAREKGGDPRGSNPQGVVIEKRKP
jgi:hypothetical protein